jgi:hypothetical protein
LLGVTSQSTAWLVALVAAVLFALPFGRSGLLATLVGIQLAEPVIGFFPLLALYVASSAASIVLVHALVEQSLLHPRAAWIHLRLAPVQSVFSPSIRRNPLLWLSVGNLVSSQWYMSALGVLAKVPRERVWAALLAGNLAAFGLGEQLPGEVELVFFDQRLPHRHAPRAQEGVGAAVTGALLPVGGRQALFLGHICLRR